MAKAPKTRPPRTLEAARPGATITERDEEADPPTYVIRVDDVRYPVWIGEVNAFDLNLLRQMGAPGVGDIGTAMVTGRLDLPEVASAMWLSRRQRGDLTATWSKIAAELTYEATIALETDEDDVDEESSDELSPEASGEA